MKHFQGTQILRKGKFEPGEFYVQDGKIASRGYADEKKDFGNSLVVPGFIDIQVNGSFGVDLTRHPERINEVIQKLPSTGVTSFLATIISQKQEAYELLLKKLQTNIKQDGANVFGVHLEGPFFCKKQHGAHNKEVIVEKCDLHFWENLFSSDLSALIKMCTFAPEIQGSTEMLALLKEKGVIASCGHSSICYDAMIKAKKEGLSCVTHLFNAMKGLHHRNPGIIGFVLGDKGIPFSLIADGVHVHESVVRMCWNAFSEGLILTTDASAALGTPQGVYTIGDSQVEVRENGAYIQGTDVLAGSICPMNKMCYLLTKFTGCTQAEAICTATERPAKLLGIEKQKGFLENGYDADFCVLDPDSFDVLETYVGGKRVFVRSVST